MGPLQQKFTYYDDTVQNIYSVCLLCKRAARVAYPGAAPVVHMLVGLVLWSSEPRSPQHYVSADRR
jgi:hypothetical protein